jgi:putative ABC transport system permease protein
MFKNYLKTAVRNLVRQKFYTLINVLGLTIGFLSCLIIFIIIGYQLSFDRFHQNRDTIYRTILDAHVDGIGPLQHCGSFEWMGAALKQDYPEIIDYVRLFEITGATSVQYKDDIYNIYSFYYTDPSVTDHRVGFNH